MQYGSIGVARKLEQDGKHRASMPAAPRAVQCHGVAQPGSTAQGNGS